MKTVFVTIFQGVEAKNILRTNIYKKLIEKDDIRLVLFVPSQERADYHKKEFNHSRVIYEVIENYKPHRLDSFFSKLKFLTLKTDTTKLRRKMLLEENKNYFSFLVNSFLNSFFSLRPIRKTVRQLDSLLVSDINFKKYYDKYRPEAVFMAHLFDDIEISMLREAKKRGVRTIGFINSWDKLTARCSIRLLPDRLVVFNNLVKKEALRHADMREDDIILSGIPQYDIYTNRQAVSREDFFARVGLDHKKKLLVYAPMGKTYSNSDWDILDLLKKWQEEKVLPEDLQILVRFQPNDFVDEAEIKARPWLVYDKPGVRFSTTRGVNWDMTFGDIDHLHDTIYHMDLLVCYASSMSVDAATLSKPVINIDFEVSDRQLMVKSPTHFYSMTHYKNAVMTGGISYPKTSQELAFTIKEYLKNSKLNEAGRERLIKEQVWRLDGRAGERIANIIIS